MGYTEKELKKTCAKEITQATDLIVSKMMDKLMTDLTDEQRVKVEMKAKQCMRGWLNSSVYNTYINMLYNASKA